jgi:hypothetical protein
VETVAVPVARYAAIALGPVTAVVLAASPATRWFARVRRRDDPGYGQDLPLLFDVNTEATVPTWYSAGLLLAVAGVCGVLVAVSVVAERSGRRWAVLAAVFTLMALDETVAVHERLGPAVEDLLDVSSTGLLRHSWVVAGVVLAVALAGVAAWAVVTLPRAPRRWVGIGLGTYVGGALALEAASGAVLDGMGDGLAYAAVTSLEEGAEMTGALVALCGLLAALDVRVRGGAVQVGLASDVVDQPAGVGVRR